MRKRIVCTEQQPVGQPASHAHIVAVGIGASTDKATERMTLDQVLLAMRTGDTFYTQGPTSGKEAAVKPEKCSKCGRDIIKSAPDAVHDNNLDNLQFCKW